MTFVVTTTRTDEWIEVHPAWVVFDRDKSSTHPPVQVPVLICDSLGNVSSFVNRNSPEQVTSAADWPDDIKYWALVEIHVPLRG